MVYNFKEGKPTWDQGYSLDMIKQGSLLVFSTLSCIDYLRENMYHISFRSGQTKQEFSVRRFATLFGQLLILSYPVALAFHSSSSQDGNLIE